MTVERARLPDPLAGVRSRTTRERNRNCEGAVPWVVTPLHVLPEPFCMIHFKQFIFQTVYSKGSCFIGGRVDWPTGPNVTYCRVE